MSTHLVTFSDESMSRARELCVESAKCHGVNITGHRYSPADTSTLLLNNGVLPIARGCGFWAWKPAIILDAMDKIGIIRTKFNFANDDYLIYSDVGIEFINHVSHVVNRMDQDIFLFGNNWEHAHWCKRDVVEKVWPTFADDLRREPWEFVADSATWSRFGKQCQASVIFFRVSDYTRAFVAEWLKWCLFEGGRLIDDSPSRAPNHPEFRENRHDQAILTTMAYREGIKLHYWPSVYNRGGSPEFVYEKLPEYAGDDYPILFNHHRRRNHEWRRIA
jgi:hypothetical protein